MSNGRFVFFLAVLMAGLVTGCSSVDGMQKKDLEYLSASSEAGMKWDLENSYEYRLDYQVDNNIYRYFTILVKPSYKYIQVLVKNGRPVSISVIGREDAISPGVSRCTLFPFREGLHVDECLEEFNKEVISLGGAAWKDEALVFNNNEKKRLEGERNETFTEIAVLSPITVPVALVMAPFYAGSMVSEVTVQKKTRIDLGRQAGLAKIIEKVPESQISRVNDKGTFYIASGVLMRTPSIGVGFDGNNVVWIQRSPRWLCSGGFMFWGNECVFGDFSKKDSQ